MNLTQPQAIGTLGDVAGSSRRKRGSRSANLKSKKRAANAPEIVQEDWDFKSKCSKEELEWCYMYEYGRSSEIVRKIWKRGVLLKKKDGRRYRSGEGKTPVIFEEPFPHYIVRFTSKGMGHFMRAFTEFPEKPWQTISKEKRERLVSGFSRGRENLNKAFSVIVRKFSKKNRRIVKLSEFLKEPSLLEFGDKWVMSIDWKLTNTKLMEMFKEWLDSNPRPRNRSSEKNSGRKSFFQDSLNALGALRLLWHFKDPEKAVEEIVRCYPKEGEAVYSDGDALRRAAAKAAKILEEHFGRQMKDK